MKPRVRQTVFPLLTALIWGMAFSAQSVCGSYLSPFAINAIRYLFAGALMLIVCLLRKNRRQYFGKPWLLGSIFCGAALFLASNLQQMGIDATSAGKAGFVTALYIVLVPLFGIFLRKKVEGRIWLAVAIAVVGLYFLCVSEQFAVATGDFYLLACALLFTVQILCVDHFAKHVDGLALSCGQFLVSGLLSVIVMIVSGQHDLSGAGQCLWSLFYISAFSTCVAYTLQILAQKDGNPTLVSLLFSLESVFAVLGGALLLHERLSGRELFGCVLMMSAIALAEVPMPRKRKVS